MISSSRRRVAVIGQGYVGLPVAHAAVHAGHTVVGYDIDADKATALALGESPIDDVSHADLSVMLACGRYRPTCDPAALERFDVAIVTVPTPLNDRRPDLAAVAAAARTLAPRLRPGVLVVLESTVAPGTTRGEFTAALEENPTGLRAGRDFHVAFSPERIDPGNTAWRFTNTPKLVGGTDPASTAEAVEFYRSICRTVVPCPDAATAEMAKLLENTYRHINIALVNELGRHAHALGIDIWSVIDAASTKPYGFQSFYPGPGVGGHCLPVDPAYLSDRIESTLGRHFDFVDLAMRINADQPRYVAERATALLNEQRQAVNGARILVLGLAYKANTADVRESPAIDVVDQLRRLGAAVTVADPHLDGLGVGLAARWPDVKFADTPEVPAAAAAADLTVLVTDHAEFDHDAICDRARLVLDTRNRLPRQANIHAI